MKIYTTSREDYLKAVYVLSKSINKVRSIDVANYMGFSKSSICKAVSRLTEEGYLFTLEHGLYLTSKGKELAKMTYEKYYFFSNQLITLGISPKTAHEDACKLEHAISDEAFLALKSHFASKNID